MWRDRFGGGFGPVVRQNTEWMNILIFKFLDSKLEDRRFCTEYTRFIKNPFLSWKLATWHYFAHRNIVSISVIRINPTYWMGKLWQKVAGAVELPRAIQPTLHSESISCTCWVLRGRYCPETPLQAPIRRLCLLTSLQAVWRCFSSYSISIPGRSIVQRMLVCLVSSSKGPVFMRHLYSHHRY